MKTPPGGLEEGKEGHHYDLARTRHQELFEGVIKSMTMGSTSHQPPPLAEAGRVRSLNSAETTTMALENPPPPPPKRSRSCGEHDTENLLPLSSPTAAAAGGGATTAATMTTAVPSSSGSFISFNAQVHLIVSELLKYKEEAERHERESRMWQEECLRARQLNEVLAKLINQSAGAATLAGIASLRDHRHKQQHSVLEQSVTDILSRALQKDSASAAAAAAAAAAASSSSLLLGPKTPTTEADSAAAGDHRLLTPQTPSPMLSNLAAQAVSRQQEQLNALIQQLKQQQSAGTAAGGETVDLRDLKQHLLFPQLGVMEPPSSDLRTMPTMTARAPKRNRGMNLPRKAVRGLKEYLYDHFDNPYPSETQKGNLANELGLDVVQVNTWFINARMRLWKPKVEAIFSQMKERVESNLRSIGSQGDGGDKGAELNHRALLDKYHKVKEAEDPRAKVAFMMTDEWAERKMKEKKVQLKRELESERGDFLGES
ncbi:homeobox KN domain-containing protein [Chloropicon primus]|uniref:Homeobox domain-containing protein n=1 Tax=Chloropicon primus TaxID=1764295 RepID=A0A5B8MKM8_9CHLO|nr:hypothetical protein A3770_04p27730 [Chloropicon primus]UPQ99464.1 homeobox KN domain-containing protein [Chloropicon primus]|eukprot:QDZ20255.1 hypothetical protein A3770_04p27730 [Chloropicon primus]